MMGTTKKIEEGPGVFIGRTPLFGMTTPSKVGSVFCAKARKGNNNKRGLILMINYLFIRRP